MFRKFKYYVQLDTEGIDLVKIQEIYKNFGLLFSEPLIEKGSIYEEKQVIHEVSLKMVKNVTFYSTHLLLTKDHKN